MKTNKIPKNNFLRSLNWAWRQKAKTKVCPLTPKIDSKVMAITGGNSAVGLETAKGLLERGAEVIILSRNKEKSTKIVESLKNKGKINYVPLDLGDLTTISPATSAIQKILNGRKLDTLILNAGIGATYPHTLSPQGYELTFAVNVLGHHALFKNLHEKQVLKSNGHVIAITGDLYFQANDCTPDYEYEGKRSMQAYARSKVGVMWWGLQCHKLYPNYKVNLVHPGVIPAGLGQDGNSLSIRIASKILITPKRGAQTTLNVATQPNIENGAYYHNTMGKAILPEGDIALDEERAGEFWRILENICVKDL
ncbi:SDR family NAD(P)-dependent oxidoreductase [Tenacibaculum ovolyticum]|uniref:SDR family NAD(P)-dependent oxidoreductase n=1 Tax=Tenacibaculum ovolyticum TaxID=104270 RepID=UPI003BACA057